MCHIGEMYITALSIYMDGGGNKQPLPTSDEVLLCSHDTTVEEVYDSLFYIIGELMKGL